jgi:ketosteroid isomerase-like protein
MKKPITKSLLFAILMVSIVCTSAKAQTSTAKAPRYKDFVGENPDADADVKLVSDYVNKLVAGDVDKAVSVLSSDFKGFGPGPSDSGTAKTEIDEWKHNDSVQTNRKVDFVAETFNVKSGDQIGHWVSMWGTYSFTENGKDVKFPYQYTAHVKNGKIDRAIIYYDQLSILKALGFSVTPPPK